MQYLKISFIILLVIYAIIFITLCVKTKNRLKTFIQSAFLGLIAMFLINLFAKVYSGVYIPVNSYSLFTVVAFSLPGVIGLMLMNIILK